MKYNFDEMIDRSGTDCIKWSKKYLKEYYEDENCIPMWIADMDFKSPQPVVEAIIKRASHGIFGYGTITDEFLEAVVFLKLNLLNLRVHI
jgi:cystathionine beta-lyase